MKKFLLSFFLAIGIIAVSYPAFADTFWNYSSNPAVKGSGMKASVTLDFDVPGSGAQKTVKFTPDHLVFHLNDDAGSNVDTDIEIADSANGMTLTAGMRGGALQAGNKFTVSASFNPESETAHPFSFTGPIDSMTEDGLMTSIVQGTLVESVKSGVDQNKASLNATFKIVGKLEGSNNPALITVTLSGTVNKIP